MLCQPDRLAWPKAFSALGLSEMDSGLIICLVLQMCQSKLITRFSFLYRL